MQRPVLSAEQVRKRNKVYAAVVISALAVVLLLWGYFSGVSKYREQYFPNTTAMGIEFADMGPGRVQTMADELLSAYELTITGYGMDQHIGSADIELAFASKQSAQDALSAQNPYLWPFMMFGSHDASEYFKTTFDHDKLADIVRSSVDAHNEGASGPTDEKLAFNTQTGQWEYVASTLGNTIAADPLVPLADEAVSKLQPGLEIPESCIVHPEGTGQEAVIKQAAQKANELCSKYQEKFTLAETTPFEIDATTAAQWITVSDTYDVSIDQAKVDEWLSTVKNLLSGANERTFVRPDGKVCTVTGGDYGWKAEDPDAAIAAIKNALETGTTSVTDIPCSVVGNGFLGIPGADWGKRFADVDIDEQHSRFYDERGELIWETDVITGVWGTSYATPTGVYTITEKRSPAALRSTGTYTYVDENGEEQTEEDHVFGRDVEYWMPFIGTFIGFHDAWWQSSFGGNLYYSPSLGSGGCVNLPTDKAKELYDIIQPGDVVVVHN